MSQTITTANGVSIPLDSLPVTLAYSGTLIDNLQTSYAGNSYMQAFVNSGSVAEYISNWQPIIQIAPIIFNTAQVIGMYATPLQLLPAPPAGSTIIPVSFELITTVSTAFAGGGSVIVQFGNSAHGAGTIATAALIPSTNVTSATTQTFTQGGILVNNAVPNQGIYLSNQTGAFTGGAGSTLTANLGYITIPFAV